MNAIVTFLAIISFASFIFFVIGLFSPKTSLFWYNKKVTRGKSILIYLPLSILCSFIVGMNTDANNESSSKKGIAEDSITVDNAGLKEKDVIASNWSYSENEDAMTSDKMFFATTESTNVLNFDFPYNGGSTAQLIIRFMNNSNNVILKISKGQFLSSLSDDAYLRIKFDEEKPVNFGYTKPTDGSVGWLFINSSKQFLDKLKGAKKLMIEAPFFQEGRQILYFNVKELDWNK